MLFQREFKLSSLFSVDPILFLSRACLSFALPDASIPRRICILLWEMLLIVTKLNSSISKGFSYKFVFKLAPRRAEEEEEEVEEEVKFN